jgi:hypothetical protein
MRWADRIAALVVAAAAAEAWRRRPRWLRKRSDAATAW